MEGTTVSRRYRIDRRIGEGGMADVYLGHDLLLNRAVAIKVLRAQYAADPAFRTRFEREAQAAAGFTHPNIIDIYDVGEEAGRPYIVMEYIRGETLKTIIETEGPFAPDDVAELLDQVSAALDYAHARGLVHRDVKPQNILVAADGLGKVVDFGIAKGSADTHLTEAGVGLGTVHYLSPEQAGGLMATPSSDIYALGVIAFEMLTGRLPFNAATPLAIALQHVQEVPPRPSLLVSSIPPAVDAIVLRALEKDPTKRYPTARAFATAMHQWRGPTSDSAFQSAAPTTATPVVTPTVSTPTVVSTNYTPPTQVGLPVQPVTPPPTSPTATTRRSAGPGGGSWLLGGVMLTILVGLVIVGALFSDRLAGFGGDDDPTATATTTAGSIVNEPTATTAAGTGDEPTEQPEPEVTTTVPIVVGLSREEATNALRAAGYAVRVDTVRVYSDTVPVDTVAEQNPTAESPAEPGTTVVLKLSQGSSLIDLVALNLNGSSPDEAEQRLRDLGLQVVREEIGSAEVPAGQVIGTSPAESARVMDTVILQISLGDKVRVPPEIWGIPFQDATTQLTQLGFQVAETQGVNRATIESQGVDLAASGIENGDVVGITGPPETSFGAWIDRGAEVTFIVYDASLDS